MKKIRPVAMILLALIICALFCGCLKPIEMKDVCNHCREAMAEHAVENDNGVMEFLCVDCYAEHTAEETTVATEPTTEPPTEKATTAPTEAKTERPTENSNKTENKAPEKNSSSQSSSNKTKCEMCYSATATVTAYYYGDQWKVCKSCYNYIHS